MFDEEEDDETNPEDDEISTDILPPNLLISEKSLIE